MSLRDALAQSPLLSLGLIAGMAWIVYTFGTVLAKINYWNPVDVGQTAGTGIVGLFVLTVMLVLALTLFSGLGHDEPTAETWPPE